MTFASLCEPRPELGESRKTWAYKCPAGSFNIKHICILRSVLPTLACQKEHLDLSGVAYFLSQTWPGSQEEWEEEEGHTAVWGLDAFLSATPQAD